MIEGKKLAPKCRELVLAAAPKDARAYFETSASRNAVVQMVSASLAPPWRGGKARQERALARGEGALSKERLLAAHVFPVCVCAQVNQMQKAAGLDAVLVDPTAASGSTVTVTGWVALACIISLIVVIVGGSVLLYRRFVTGEDKPHTLHVKMGDA